MKMYKRNKYFEIIENSNFVDFNGVKKFMGNIINSNNSDSIFLIKNI